MMTHRGTSRPMRAGGLLLLGVAAVAAVIGTASAITDDGDQQGLRPPEDPGTSVTETNGVGDPTTTKPTPSSEPSEPSPSSEAPASSEPATPPSSSAPAGGTGSGEGAGDGGGKGDAVKSISVRVYNNSNIKGLANRAAEDLRADGWNVVETGNYSDGVIYTTTAYYTPGTGEKSAAEAIGAEFGMRVEPRFDGIKDSSPGVIVIVTRDYSGG